MKFLIVTHSWHVYGKGFETYEVECDSEQDAHTRAKVIKSDTEQPFKRVAVHVIPLGCNETILKRKLTLTERLVGVASFPPAEIRNPQSNTQRAKGNISALKHTCGDCGCRFTYYVDGCPECGSRAVTIPVC